MGLLIPEHSKFFGFGRKTATKRLNKGQFFFRFAVLFSVIFLFSACSLKPEPPEDWNNRILVYKSLSSDTGFAGYYLSFQEKTFLTFEQFLSTLDRPFKWREDPEGTWILTLNQLDLDLTDNGPIEMYFKKEQSPSGNINILLMKIITKDYEIPWVLLDQVVMEAGERYNAQNKVK